MSDYPVIRDLWDFGDVAKSEGVFREWMAKVPDSDAYHLELQTQLARTFGLRGQFEAAHDILNAIEPMIATAPVVEVRYCLERGRTYNSAGQADEAIPLFEQAWDIARANRLDGLAIDAGHMMAIALPDAQDQIEWHNKCLEAIEASDQAAAKKWLGSIYNNLGWTYHDMGDYEQALKTFVKGLTWHREYGTIASSRIAKYTVGRTLRSMKRYADALEMQTALLAEHKADGGEDGFASEEIGECLLALDRAAEAGPHFQRAYDLLKAIPWVEAERLDRIKQLSA